MPTFLIVEKGEGVQCNKANKGGLVGKLAKRDLFPVLFMM